MKYASIITLVGMLLAFLSVIVRPLETRYFPAASPMVLTDAYQEGGYTVFAGTSARLRPGCSPLRLEWSLGVRNGQTAPATALWGRPKQNDNGAFSFEGWTVDVVPVERFKEMSHGDVIHQCRLFYRMVDDQAVGGFNLPWETRTQFWN